MNKFPLEPSYSKALLSSIMMNCEQDMIILVSILSSETLWNKPSKIKEDEFKKYEEQLNKYQD